MDMNNVIELNHPLIEHKLGILRNKKTGNNKGQPCITQTALSFSRM